MRSKATSIDDFLAGVSPEQRVVLERLRRAVRSVAPKVAGFQASKGTIRFQLERPLPLSLVKKLVKARIAENAARRGVARRRR